MPTLLGDEVLDVRLLMETMDGGDAAGLLMLGARRFSIVKTDDFRLMGLLMTG